VFGFGTAADGQWLLARVKDASPMKKLAADHSEEWQSLGVSLLHKLLLDELIFKSGRWGTQVPVRASAG